MAALSEPRTRALFRGFAFTPCLKDAKTPKEPSQLEQALNNNVMRQEIFNYLRNSPDLAVKARFCAAVQEYERLADRREKLSKARKIVANFVQPGARFQVNLDAVARDELMIASTNFTALLTLKAKYLEELENHENLQMELPDIWGKVYVCSEYY